MRKDGTRVTINKPTTAQYHTLIAHVNEIQSAGDHDVTPVAGDFIITLFQRRGATVVMYKKLKARDGHLNWMPSEHFSSFSVFIAAKAHDPETRLLVRYRSVTDAVSLAAAHLKNLEAAKLPD